ncbi:hypothetical protein BS47DRAFT_1114437 [Hydnum rufescens UP504]|uniref:Uncharacterized protein n=1 Tax=Hydnum rufescens UP504 TaxID=1448309 RepID=A0A9P6DVT6_9AGAM|nr:hypothetical protein BS47DRAFT_1114437 [Hydnum rufescens UP504]
MLLFHDRICSAGHSNNHKCPVLILPLFTDRCHVLHGLFYMVRLSNRKYDPTLARHSQALFRRSTRPRFPNARPLGARLPLVFPRWLGRIGDKLGSKTRRALVPGTLVQAALTLAACLSPQYSHQTRFSGTRADPSWTDTLGFLALAFSSASMGLQGYQGTRLGSQFATTVVLTTIWVNKTPIHLVLSIIQKMLYLPYLGKLVTDPKLFYVRAMHKPRDYKILGLFGLFIGGLTGRALANTIGPAATLGLGQA